MIRYFIAMLFMTTLAVSCQQTEDSTTNSNSTTLATIMTLDPGHFHSALVQKNMYPEVDSHAFVFAPEGDEVKMHLEKIEQYNNRSENPTHWNEVV
ncbi:MAG TPA: hypothetical protein VKZ54_12800, partial [Membranihabitans sp.]|nr:hypothetical protein [Membranihabitans sp.]